MGPTSFRAPLQGTHWHIPAAGPAMTAIAVDRRLVTLPPPRAGDESPAPGQRSPLGDPVRAVRLRTRGRLSTFSGDDAPAG
jgi:hypothetical protein